MNAWTIAEVNRAKALHEKGMTTGQIGIELNRSGGGVRHVLRANGVKMRLGRPNGPPKDPFASDEDRIRNGSMKLLDAILRAGVRP